MKTSFAFIAGCLFLGAAVIISGCDSYEAPTTSMSDTEFDAQPDNGPSPLSKAFSDFPPPVLEGFRVTLLGPPPVYGERRTSFVWELTEVGDDDDINHFAVQLAECAGDDFSSPDQFNVNSSTGVTGRAGQFRTNEGNDEAPYRFTLNFPAPGVVVGYGEVEIKVDSNDKSKALYLVPCANTSDINGDVFVDDDGDTVKDPGESGLGGVTVSVIDNAGTFIASKQTAADGSYSFTGLLDDPEAYQVRVPKGSNSTLYAERMPTGATLADGTAFFSTVIGTSADDGCGVGNECDADIGFTPLSFDISGFVSVDPNNSDTGTGDELIFAGIPNVTVELIPLDAGGSCGPTCQTTTDGNGQYSFSNVPAGSYVVSIDDVTAASDFNEDLDRFYDYTGVDARPNDGGAQLEVTVGPDATEVDFAWEALTGEYTQAYSNDPNFVIFSLGVTEWLHAFQKACRANDDANYLIQYKDRFKQVQTVPVQFLIDNLNDFLYPNVPPEPFANSCDVADALSQPLAGGRNNVDDLTKLYWQLLAAELNYWTEHLGLVINPAGDEDGQIPETMLRYMEDFIGRELFGGEGLSKQSGLYDSEEGMLNAYNGGGGGGGTEF